jgi:hypothetical protein
VIRTETSLKRVPDFPGPALFAYKGVGAGVDLTIFSELLRRSTDQDIREIPPRNRQVIDFPSDQSNSGTGVQKSVGTNTHGSLHDRQVHLLTRSIVDKGNRVYWHGLRLSMPGLLFVGPDGSGLNLLVACHGSPRKLVTFRVRWQRFLSGEEAALSL